MPGVPPDASSQIKKLVKSMFGRGRKTKRDSVTSTSTSPTIPKTDKPVVPAADAARDNPLPPTQPQESAPRLTRLQSPVPAREDSPSDRPDVSPITTPVDGTPTDISPTSTNQVESIPATTAVAIGSVEPAPGEGIQSDSHADSKEDHSHPEPSPSPPIEQEIKHSPDQVAGEKVPGLDSSAPRAAPDTSKELPKEPTADIVTMPEQKKDESAEVRKISSSDDRVDSASHTGNEESKKGELKETTVDEPDQSDPRKRESSPPGMQATSGPLGDYYEQ